MQSTGGVCWHVKFNRVWSSGSLGGRHQDLSHCLKTCIRVWCSSLGSPKKAVRSSQLPHVAMTFSSDSGDHLHISSLLTLPNFPSHQRKRQGDSAEEGLRPQAPVTTSSGTRHCNAVLGLMDSLLESRWMNRPGRRRNVAAWIHPRFVFFCSVYKCHGSLWSEMNC